jgi:hypothetical protein
MYWPTITDARHVDSFLVGPLLAVLFTDCVSEGTIQYAHVLYVYEPDLKNPPGPGNPPPLVCCITAEVNAMAAETSGSGSHFLCMFHDGIHANMGAADDWADLDTFTQKALDVVADQFAIDREPIRMPMPGHNGYDSS